MLAFKKIIQIFYKFLLKSVFFFFFPINKILSCILKIMKGLMEEKLECVLEIYVDIIHSLSRFIRCSDVEIAH